MSLTTPEAIRTLRRKLYGKHAPTFALGGSHIFIPYVIQMTVRGGLPGTAPSPA
jgi:hypothetical protein